MPWHGVAYSPDGDLLTSAGADGTVRIWDTATGAAHYAWLPLADGGWAMLLDDLRYKLEGTPNGAFWYTINMCRFEPGELDPYVDGLRRLSADYPVLT